MGKDEKFVYTTCMGGGCHEFCCLKTFVADGRITRTEKAVLTGPEADRFECCQKGMDYGRFAGNPNRLLYPQRRVGERGEGRFERISWDEAFDEIGAKLCEIRDAHGPQSVLFSSNVAGYPLGSTGALYPAIQMRFVHAFDASQSMMTAVDGSFFGAQAIDLGDVFAYGESDPRLLEKAKHILIWGSNPIGNTRAGVTTRSIIEAKEANGATITHVGLFYNSTAAKSDRFVPIRRGTNAALALSMAREIIERGAQDDAYLLTHTVAPLLVRADTGRFLRMSDISPEGPEALYVALSEGAPVPVAPHSHDTSACELDAETELNGIACKTAFRMLREHLAQWTFERQEGVTGVPADVARAMTDEYLAAKPANIYLEEAMRYANAVQSYRAVELLAYLSGNIGVEGGGVTITGMGGGHPSGLNDAAVAIPEGLENMKGHQVFSEDVFDLDRDDYPFKAYFGMMGNPVHSNPGRGRVWEKFFDKMELVVVCDIFMSDTAKFADYLLPDTCTFERYELAPQGNHIILMEPAVERAGEVKSGTEILTGIAQRVGLGHLFELTDKEWLITRLMTNDPGYANVQPPITFERLGEEKMVRLAVPETLYDPMATDDFRTPSGRIEFYSEDYAEIGYAMAKLDPTLVDRMSDEDKAAYPLHLFVGRPRVMMQTQPFNVMEDLVELQGREPWMLMNPREAEARGVRDGDKVEAYNANGNAVMRARVSRACPPGVAQMWLSYRAEEYEQGGPTFMMETVGTYKTVDDFARRWREVQIARRGLAPGEKPSFEALMMGRAPETMNFDRSFCGNYDIIWDNCCNVRKAQA